MTIACICGDDLAKGTIHGYWTLGDLAVEYSTCRNCRSTRAFMPADVTGRLVCLYNDPTTSEVENEWDSLLDALEESPEVLGAQLIRDGEVLADSAVMAGGAMGWVVRRPT